MSAWINPTRYPSLPNETARFTATVVFPTPPLPLPIATTCATPGKGCGPCGAPAPICPIFISLNRPSYILLKSAVLICCHSVAQRRNLLHRTATNLKHAIPPQATPASPSSSASLPPASHAAAPHLQTCASD